MDILPLNVVEQIRITSHAGVPPTSIRYQRSTKRYRYPPRLQTVAHALILRRHPSDPRALNQPSFLPPGGKTPLGPHWNTQRASFECDFGSHSSPQHAAIKMCVHQSTAEATSGT